MNSKQFQFNRRSMVSLALAVLALIITVMPALAWEDEGGQNFQPLRSCRVVLDQSAELAGPCGKTVPPHIVRRNAEEPRLHPAEARAEILFLKNQLQWTQLSSR